MKKDRNCGGTPYPVYPTYPGMMPQNMMPGAIIPQSMIPGTMMGSMPNVESPSPYVYQGNTGATIEQQLSSLNNQINSLERRINNLENLVGNSANKYNNSNYQVM